MLFKRSFILVLSVFLVACGREDDPELQSKYDEFLKKTAGQQYVQSGDMVVYQGATLIDGNGGEVIENATLIVQGKKILAAGAGFEIPDNIKTIDVAGKWIVPGLIDAHIHFMVSGRIYTRPAMIDLQHIVPYEEELEWTKNRVPVTLRGYTCAGITSGLSAGGPLLEYEARELAKSMDDAPTIFNAHGPTVTLPKFIAQKFFPPVFGETIPKSATTAEEGIKLVQEAASLKADAMKTAYDYSGSFLRKMLQYNYKAVHEAIIAEAKKHNMKVTSHIHQLDAGKELMKLGVDSLQHLPADKMVDEEFIKLAKDNGVIVVPTLALRERSFVNSYDKQYKLLPVEKTCGDPEVIKSWFAVEDMPDVGSDRIKNALDGVPTAFANTKALYDGGVMLAAGTDAGLMGLIHGASLHLELKEMNAAGIPPKDLIVAATLNAAKVAGKEDEYGSVEAGKYADFLVLSKNPLDDIGNLQAIDLIVKHGKSFQQKDLLPPRSELACSDC